MIEAPTTNAHWLNAAKDLADNKTWGQLSATYRAPILNPCARSGLTPQEAEEIAQEAFHQLALQIEKTGGQWEPKTLRAWLTDVIARIGAHPINRLAELLPWNWKPPAATEASEQAA